MINTRKLEEAKSVLASDALAIMDHNKDAFGITPKYVWYSKLSLSRYYDVSAFDVHGNVYHYFVRVATNELEVIA